MFQKIINVGTLAIVPILITGCLSSQPEGPKYSLPQLKKNESITLIEAQATISNGAFITTKNEKILPERGDAIKAYTVNGVGYFILKTASGEYLLQDENENTIKKFSDAQNVKFFESGDGEPIIAVKLKNNRTNIYDNIYLFDGKKVRLTNKNVAINLNARIVGQYTVYARFDKYNDFKGYSITDITNGERVNISVSKPRVVFGMKMDGFKLLGTAGNNFIYVYKDENSDYVIEAYNTKNQQKIIIARDRVLCQLLKHGNTKVLKIFNDKKLRQESQMHAHNKSLTSKYTNKAAKYINLSSLEEVNFSNVSQLKQVPLFTSFSNMGGGRTQETYITYTISRLMNTKANAYYLK